MCSDFTSDVLNASKIPQKSPTKIVNKISETNQPVSQQALVPVESGEPSTPDGGYTFPPPSLIGYLDRQGKGLWVHPFPALETGWQRRQCPIEMKGAGKSEVFVLRGMAAGDVVPAKQGAENSGWWPPRHPSRWWSRRSCRPRPGRAGRGTSWMFPWWLLLALVSPWQQGRGCGALTHYGNK